jgi:arsenate reductase
VKADKAPYVLFVCVHNSGRSQMARAFFDSISDGTIVAQSAGTMPDEEVNPDVIQVMAEVGIDVGVQRPRLLTQEMVAGALKIVTMGCGVEEVCPVVFGETVDWGVDDPKGRTVQDVRRIRDWINAKVAFLWQELSGTEAALQGEPKE